MGHQWFSHLRRRLAAAALAGGLTAVATLVAAPRQSAGGEAATIPAVPKAVAVPGGAIELPMTIEFGIPVVSVTINGRGPFRFFLDTGASVTVIDRSLAGELNLAHAGTIRVGDPASPQAIVADIVSIDHLTIGQAELSTVQALSWDRSSLIPSPDAPRGVLGMPLFANLLVTIDYPHGRARVATATLPAPNGVDLFGYDQTLGGSFEVMVTVAGTSMKAVIDSGSGGGISFPTSAIDQLPLVAPPIAVGRGRTVAGGAAILGATLKGSFVLGGYRLDNPEVTFNERLRGVNIGSA